MFRRSVIALVVVAALPWSECAFGQDKDTTEAAEPPTAAEVQEKLRQWVLTQRLISEERADWEAEKQTLADLNELREREVGQLDELIAAAGSRLTDAEERRGKMTAEEQKLRSQRAELEKSIAGLEAAARELLPRLPRPLREQLGETIERLQADPAAVEEIPLQNRFRDVLAVLVEAGGFQSRLTLDTELREFGEQTIEVEVLYLGLANAYYTDRSGVHAGIGGPTVDGWVWTEQPDLAESIRQTIDIFQKRANPDLVELPIRMTPKK